MECPCFDQESLACVLVMKGLVDVSGLAWVLASYNKIMAEVAMALVGDLAPLQQTYLQHLPQKIIPHL